MRDECSTAAALTRDQYRKALSQLRMTQSMSRTGDCWDNAVAESFFASLRAELVDHEIYDSPAAAERPIREYIENFYNVERLHSHLDYVSPIEFELKAHLSSIAAQSTCPPNRVNFDLVFGAPYDARVRRVRDVFRVRGESPIRRSISSSRGSYRFGGR